MSREGAAAVGGVVVQRHFEANRLAKDQQARAYQELLPAVCQSTARSGRSAATHEANQSARDLEGEKVVMESVTEGVAA